MEAKKYLGIDIGGTAIKLGVVDNEGRLLCRREFKLDLSEGASVMDVLVNGIRELISADGSDISEYAGIAVSAPGSIDTKNGRVAINGGNVPGWSGTDVRSALEAEFGLPVSLANDGNCVALAEAWRGAGKGCDNLLCVVIGTGIGGGIVSGGKAVEGGRGFGGEIGHVVTHAGGKPCICGGRGCFERYASTSALVDAAMKINDEWSNGRVLFEAAESGDDRALELIDKWTDEISVGIAGLVHIFNPEIVLIGGGVSAQDDLVVRPVGEKVTKFIMPDFADGLLIKKAELGNDAGMIGAVCRLKDYLSKMGE